MMVLPMVVLLPLLSVETMGFVVTAVMPAPPLAAEALAAAALQYATPKAMIEVVFVPAGQDWVTQS